MYPVCPVCPVFLKVYDSHWHSGINSYTGHLGYVGYSDNNGYTDTLVHSMDSFFSSFFLSLTKMFCFRKDSTGIRVNLNLKRWP